MDADIVNIINHGQKKVPPIRMEAAKGNDVQKEEIQEQIFNVSKEQASSLIQKMVSLGYFHNKKNVDYQEDNIALSIDKNLVMEREERKDVEREEGKDVLSHEQELSIESLRREQMNFMNGMKHEKCDPECEVIFPTISNNKNDNSSIMNEHTVFSITRVYLKKQIEVILFRERRISLDKICDHFKVRMIDIKRAAKELSSIRCIHFIEKQHELILDSHLNELFQTKVVPELDYRGTICVSDLSRTIFNLPIDFMVDMIGQRLCTSEDMNAVDHEWSFRSDVKLINIDGVKKLITATYEEKKNNQVKDMLLETIEPIKVKDVIEAIEWDGTCVLNHIQNLCDSNELPGDLHRDPINVIGAVYIPSIYEKNQNSMIENLFNANGFVTIEQANRAGVSRKRLKEIALDIHSESVALTGCIINPDVIIAPLLTVVEECLDFVDLSHYLHNDILRNKDDVRSILTDYILNKLDVNGCLIIDDHEAIYFSQAIIDEISHKILPPLVEDFVRTRALKVADEITEMKKRSKESIKSKRVTEKLNSKGKGSKQKKRLEDHKDIHVDLPDQGLIPLKIVVDAVAADFSDLNDIQSAYNNPKASESSWYQSSDEAEEYEGPLYAFCRLALNNDSCLDQLCHTAFSAELEKIMESRKGSLLSDRSQGALKNRNIEAQFETNFAIACYFLQLATKIIDVESKLNENERNLFENHLLHHCAYYARRITEYCLFKTGFDAEGIISFDNGRGNIDENYFCSEVDICQHKIPFIFLSCTSDDLGQRQNPLKVLKDEIGVEVARMWMLTGANHYDLGHKRGDVKKFLKHVEESCLSMVSIPFKSLDKKVEKKLLLSRRKKLISELEEATDTKLIFELALMIVVQETIGVVVCTEEIYDIVLKLIIDQKKIPDEVSNAFVQFAQLLRQNDTVPAKLVSFIKVCGLSKSIKEIVVQPDET